MLAALGLFVGLVLCRNEDKRSMTARFHNVAEGNILRLCDSADISPPGAACPACPRPWLILLRICKITSIAATQSERGTEKGKRVKFIVQIKVFISVSLFDIQCFMQYNIYDA